MKVYALIYEYNDGYTYNSNQLVGIFATEQAAWDHQKTLSPYEYEVNEFCGFRVDEEEVRS